MNARCLLLALNGRAAQQVPRQLPGVKRPRGSSRPRADAPNAIVASKNLMLQGASFAGVNGSDPVLPFKPNQRQERRNDDQCQGVLIAPCPIQFRHVLEIHSVDTDDQYGWDSHDRSDGEDLHDLVLININDSGRGILKKLNSVDETLRVLDEGGDIR